MNKTTVKISVLAFLGFMTYGYAQQQQQDPHRGKVGVNTIEPSATMDIRPSTANAQKEATTNEGIIAPKLSKTRIANITTPVEGTLVYATDESTSPISAYTGGDTKVAKITEKGYYYYNGTEWVKAGNNSLAVDGSKWTNDTANNVVKLTNLSDGTTPRTDDKNIFINDDGYLGIGVRPIDRALTIVGDTYEKASVKIRRAYSSVNASPTIEFEKARGNNANLEAVKRNESLGNIAYRGYDGSNFLSGAAIVAKAEKDAEAGKIPTKFLFNLRGENDTDPVTKMVLTSEGKLGLDTGNHVPNIQFAIKNTYTGLDYIENEGLFLVSKGTSALNTGVRSIGSVEISSDTNSNFASSNNRFEGINFNVSGQERMRISEAGNVGIGTITPSEKLDVAGKIKSSALAGTGDRVVVADQDGVLKASQFVMKATDTSSSCSQENAGAIHYKEIDKGGKMVGVFGFCTRDTQGNYKWAYNMGGANMLDGTGAFGSGL